MSEVDMTVDAFPILPMPIPGRILDNPNLTIRAGLQSWSVGAFPSWEKALESMTLALAVENEQLRTLVQMLRHNGAQPSVLTTVPRTEEEPTLAELAVSRGA